MGINVLIAGDARAVYDIAQNVTRFTARYVKGLHDALAIQIVVLQQPPGGHNAT
ncbi:hypothetical protein D3C77_599920 [compost metagenome]